ncbi:MAG: twin-arginine translocation signal domain-containing protein [Candidatus Electrothrix sp. ATG1]|nr:twin-arginine translocation signal domain-containing protein [Candidatus Electrothrix sp. ATG1]
MKAINRRSFMKNSAVVTGALALEQMSPGQWLSFAYAEPTGYFKSQFGITDALCKRVLEQALSKGGDFADLYFEHTISNWLDLEDDRVDRAYGNIKLGVGIRTVKGDQVGYGFTQEMDENSLLAAAATAATIANSNGKSAAKKYVELKTPNYYPLETLLTDVPLESKLSLLQKVNKKCVNLSDLIIKVSAGFHDSQKRIMIVTSDGIKAEDIQPRNFLYSFVVAEKDGKKERASWNFGGRHDFSYYTNKVANGVAEEAVQRALVLFDAIQPPAGG